jgi:hypothetical protein
MAVGLIDPAKVVAHSRCRKKAGNSTFVNQNPSAVGLSLIPPYYTPAMTYRSETGQQIAMYPISGSHEAPVFVFNGVAVPVEEESFGSVKALYR